MFQSTPAGSADISSSLLLAPSFSLFAGSVYSGLCDKFISHTMTDNIKISRFSNGLAVLTEKMPDVRSATLGFWYRCGSRDEPAALNGISHFIEHAVFKGTAKRNALDIAIETDRLGGNFDAFTMHEQTGFTMKVIDTAVPQAFDLLADLLSAPVFDETELRREQKVIIEEMKMVEDSPDEFLGEIFQENFFAGHPLALPIEGTKNTVPTFGHETTARYHAEVFNPANLVIAAAGNIRHDEIVALAEKFFGAIAAPASGVIVAPAARRQSGERPARRLLLKNKRGLEQTHLIIAAPWFDAADEKRYAGHVLETIMGNGTSSRLWQKIREERGLAYSVGASGSSYRDCGVFNIYAATSPEHFDETVDLSIAEMRRIKNEPVSRDELELAKAQSVAAILLSLEDSGVRAGNLAQQEITYGKQISVDETIARVEQVTAAEVQQLADKYFVSDDLVLTALGNFKDVKFKEKHLKF